MPHQNVLKSEKFIEIKFILVVGAIYWEYWSWKNFISSGKIFALQLRPKVCFFFVKNGSQTTSKMFAFQKKKSLCFHIQVFHSIYTLVIASQLMKIPIVCGWYSYARTCWGKNNLLNKKKTAFRVFAFFGAVPENAQCHFFTRIIACFLP